ncbi:hypothetical protein ACO0RG_003381 [Hanseniaspora osmophila]
MESTFYQLPGSHKPSNSSEATCSTPLLAKKGVQMQNKGSFSYFTGNAAGNDVMQRKISSKFDPENPHKHKLGTYDGVFVPTTLNVLSILMFLRFGFIIGQMGILGTLALLVVSYLIDLLTTMSVSAIATNGTVLGGGAYTLISRCLGPEFGGSIGIIFFIGQILNSGMNVVGIIEPIMFNFNAQSGVIAPILPTGHWHEFMYSTILLMICFGVCLIGSQTVSKVGNVLFWLLLMATVSIPISALCMPAFSSPIEYTGFSIKTLKENMLPHFTSGAAGSLLKKKETLNDLFGIFFPATAGIFAGAGMSSELRKPSRSIPKGTLWGLLLTFSCYFLVIVSLGSTVPRSSMHKDVSIIQTVSGCQPLILIGEMATSLFSVIVGIIGAAYVLEAIAKDEILPGLNCFHKHPSLALFLSWFLTQLCLFSDVNQIATFITMTFLMTFIVTNVACFLLEISSAPNFRPSFKYFNRFTASMGGLLSIVAMFVVDGFSALGVMFSLIALCLLIHYTCPPKQWGDVSQNLIYHQVRKYLLRLKQDNIKYWRPQILLLVDSPRSSWNLIKFCNHMKKGGLYILGHVITVKKAHEFQKNYNELQLQKTSWEKVRDYLKIKAFVHIGLGQSLQWGVRNVFLGSGLGGMRPNITVLGLIESEKKSEKYLKNGEIPAFLPTDNCKNESRITKQQWVQLVEDLSLMKSNIAIAKGFYDLELPLKNHTPKQKKYIDLYPIQMTANLTNGKVSTKTTNFDTYTLILQLGAILTTVPAWHKSHILRCIVFVENEFEKIDEYKRITQLLSVLRIEARVHVLVLSQFRVYNTIIKGDSIALKYVNQQLKNDAWWADIVKARKDTNFSSRRFSYGDYNNKYRIDKKLKPKSTVSELQRFGVSLTMSSNIPVANDMFLFNENAGALDESADETDLESSTPSVSTTQKKPKNTKKEDKSNIIPVFSSDAIPRTKVIEDATGVEPSLIPVENAYVPIKKHIKPQLSPCQSMDNLHLKELDFNSVPRKAQLLILNDMMTQLSGNNSKESCNTNLILSTLPIPMLGTHMDEEASEDYINDLNLWLDELPPTLLINSQSMTVTTAL